MVWIALNVQNVPWCEWIIYKSMSRTGLSGWIPELSSWQSPKRQSNHRTTTCNWYVVVWLVAQLVSGIRSLPRIWLNFVAHECEVVELEHECSLSPLIGMECATRDVSL